MPDPSDSYLLQVQLRHIANLVLLLGFVLALAGEMLLPAPGSRWDRARLIHGAHNFVLWLIGVVVVSFVFGSVVCREKTSRDTLLNILDEAQAR